MHTVHRLHCIAFHYTAHSTTLRGIGDAGKNILSLKKGPRGVDPVISIVVAQPHEPLSSPPPLPSLPRQLPLNCRPASYSGTLKALPCGSRSELVEHWKVSLHPALRPLVGAKLVANWKFPQQKRSKRLKDLMLAYVATVWQSVIA